MKVLAVFVCAVACSSAQFFYVALPYKPAIQYRYTTISAPVYTSSRTQYHAQDALGQFIFHHAGDNQIRTETKSLDGAVRGAYSYVDPTGKLINVQYVADSNGYRVLGANNLPEAPSASFGISKGPEPVQDTPEVAAAKAAFQKQYEAVAKASESAPDMTPVSRKKRDTLLYHPLYPVLSKSKVKVHEFEPVEGANTPADTKKYEFKVKEEHEVLTHSVPVAYTTFLPSAVSVVNQDVVPSVGLLQQAVVPSVVKSNVKVQDFVPVEGAKTPADTKKI